MTKLLPKNFPSVTTSVLIPDQPLCFPPGSPGAMGFDQLQVATVPVKLTNTERDGNNIKTDIINGDRIFILKEFSSKWDKCQNVRVCALTTLDSTVRN
jgi:hypothetical protein